MFTSFRQTTKKLPAIFLSVILVDRYEFPCLSNSYDHDPSKMWSSEIECEIIFSPREQYSKIIVKIIDLQEDHRGDVE
uniref:Uncharacterized protein n=1 Tax=Trichogramma kaykai TaxID=54128 RepID=A0ABD2WI86_9HYME